MTTPMFRQYRGIKKKLKNEILFFRMGDFYEMFYDDAKVVSKVLGLALTAKANGKEKVPMAGVPFHAADNYLHKLIRAGYKVAICDQVEDAKQAKGLVKREITRVVTPGTLMEDDLLVEKQANYLLSLFVHKGRLGLSWLDISTGEFFGLDSREEFLLDELGKISPVECLVPENIFRNPSSPIPKALKSLSIPVSPMEDWHFESKKAQRKLKELLGVKSLAGFGIQGEECFLASAGALLEYVQSTQGGSLAHIRSICKIQLSHYMHLDLATQRTLELVQTMSGGDKRYSLLGVLDKTETPMGGRLLRHWILHPLMEVDKINYRQEGVGELVAEMALREDLVESLERVYDLERLSIKISSGQTTPRDLVNLAISLDKLPEVKKILSLVSSPILKDLEIDLDSMEDIRDLLKRALSDHPPLHLSDGSVIRDGFDSQLDELRTLSEQGQQWLDQYQKEEALKLEIPSLKIGYTNISGYYISITHTHGHKVPDYYIRKQTLKNAERYVTAELKEYEEKVLTARERSLEIEMTLFEEIRQQVALQVNRILKTASSLSHLDCLLSLARVAVENSYRPPTITEDLVLFIQDGRHPVLETTLQESFVPNDILMDPSSYVFLITGPNMAGKSTYIRQIGLITLMAHIGSFVPATSATIGLVDKLFTRLGSTDELYLGYSTFMVEMLETSNILNNATNRSLVLLDEVGRGTSTYDGVSLAWAISEYLHERLKCRTLFATHYHELTQLAQKFPQMANFSVSLREWEEGEFVFLHKIQPGPANRSYGIHVARLAGMPKAVTDRGQEILRELEEGGATPAGGDGRDSADSTEVGEKILVQLPLFKELKIESKVIKKLRKLALDQLTPLEALNRLKELQDLARKGE